MIRARTLLAGAAALALAGCVAGPAPKIATPPPELPGDFAYTPPQAVAASVDSLLPQDDPAFAALAQAALNDAPSLAQAAARIESARAAARGARAERLPSFGANASVTGTRTNPSQFGANLPAGIAIDTERVSYGANLTASWDADLFGHLRGQERAAQARVDAANADAAGVRLALLAEIAGAVIDWRTLEAREAVLQQDLVAAQSLVSLADIRSRAGIAPGIDLVRARTAADASRSQLETLAVERARLTGQLVTLTAQSAQAVQAALAQGHAPATAPAAPASQPSELLANRPDVLAAAARVYASDAQLYSAAAARFPRLTLSATLGLLAYGLGDLFNSDSLVGSAGGSLLAPLIDFGRVQAQIDSAAADKQAAFAAYRGAVFQALGEAEAAYGTVAATDRTLAAATSARDGAARTERLAEVRFRAGLADFRSVLDARQAALASAEQTVAAEGSARRARVLLWQALGGGGQAQPTTRVTSQ